MITSPIRLIAIAVIALMLAACATHEKTGTIVGAAAGAVVAAAIDDDPLAIAAGAVIGGVIGNRIGARMDRNDRKRTAHALEYNAARQSSIWVNPDTGHEFRLTPERAYQTNAGPCRDFEMMAKIDDGQELMRGTACRRQDGTWVTQ